MERAPATSMVRVAGICCRSGALSPRAAHALRWRTHCRVRDDVIAIEIAVASHEEINGIGKADQVAAHACGACGCDVVVSDGAGCNDQRIRQFQVATRVTSDRPAFAGSRRFPALRFFPGAHARKG